MAPEKTSNRRNPWLSLLLLLVKFSIAALFIALPVRWFVAQPFLVSGASMEPNINPDEYLVIDKIWYQAHAPERGDVIILRYPLDPSVFFVKRIIGLPGETINIANGVVTVLASGGTSMVLHEPYIVATSTRSQNSTTALAKDEYFVLGDNRTQSSDSRDWGPLQAKFIVGRAFARLYPLIETQILPAQYRFPVP